MTKNKKDCAFQYYDGVKTVADKTNLTLHEAKDLWNEHYDGMVKMVEDGRNIEAVIWINMDDEYDYYYTLIHLSSPQVENKKLWEPQYYTKFKQNGQK
jgi:hypothetical protein